MNKNIPTIDINKQNPRGYTRYNFHIPLMFIFLSLFCLTFNPMIRSLKCHRNLTYSFLKEQKKINKIKLIVNQLPLRVECD